MLLLFVVKLADGNEPSACYDTKCSRPPQLERLVNSKHKITLSYHRRIWYNLLHETAQCTHTRHSSLPATASRHCALCQAARLAADDSRPYRPTAQRMEWRWRARYAPRQSGDRGIRKVIAPPKDTCRRSHLQSPGNAPAACERRPFCHGCSCETAFRRTQLPSFRMVLDELAQHPSPSLQRLLFEECKV